MRPGTPTLETLFAAAMELDDPAARSDYLDQACADDLALRHELASLLGAGGRAGNFLESPACRSTVLVSRALESAGTVIGPYKLLEQIGEGGMGVVYVAEQSEPVRRKVALKVIKPGMDTKQVVVRFEAERQALAMMDHPNIARVYDGGSTPDGRPFFAMELVRGIPITEYCDREQLSISERLDLFVLVCRAVQHAHQKGVIHRDLKPSNVLVTMIDGVAVPKVIDFGVAKATSVALTERTLYTGFHQFVGTPLYMSPEQADVAGVDVDTRSDIYSLGVLLYELLTGTTPFDRETFHQATFDEMRRMIREDEPPRPSTRLSALGTSRTSISANRKGDPRHLDRAVRGELDWIVMKALEKDRSRRYETVSDFAADVMRYLTDRPVEACPPTVWYRFGKYARRNRAAITTAALVVVALATGVTISTWQAIRATTAEHRASTALVQAEDHLTLARQAVDELYDEAAAQWLFDLRFTPLPKPFLEKVLPFYQRFADQPRADVGVGRARRRVGEIQIQLGNKAEASRSLRSGEVIFRALVVVEPGNHEHLRDLATTIDFLAFIDSDRALQLEAIALREQLAARFPSDTRDLRSLATAVFNFGTTLWWHGEQGAEPYLTRALKLREQLVAAQPGDPGLMSELSWAIRQLGNRHRDQFRWEEAERAFRRSLTIDEELVRRHPTRPGVWLQLGWSTCGIADMLLRTGRPAEAEPVADRSVTIFEGLANDYPGLLGARRHAAPSLSLQATSLFLCGRPEDARKILRRIEDVTSPQSLGEWLKNIAWYLTQSNATRVVKPGVALELAQRAVDCAPENVGAWHVLGMARYRAGRWDDAIAALSKANELERDKGFAFNGFFIAMAYQKRGDPARAREWFNRSTAWMTERKTTDRNAFRYRDEAAAVLGMEKPPSAEVTAPRK